MKKLILILSYLLLMVIAYSQPPPPTPQPIPIDGGLFALAVGGIILGGREVYLHEKRKRQKNLKQ